MNKKLALFVMFLLISTSLCFAVLSKNDAENILLSSIVHDRIGQVDVYLYDELMPLNENVACAGYTVLTPFNSNWVAFIDEAPAFNDPTSYVLKVKKPGSDEYIEKAVDLIETFNYLIGLRLVHLGIPQSLSAAFTCLPDPDLPEDQDTKLIINGDFKQVPDGKWWIRKVIGWALKNPYSPNDGSK
ncbi:MAG: hypothetical protein RBS43_08305, partial [Candidatus Cloacimonas sp.]|nr:hypothetical protein [Candidatus Cloacimonas sp.]